MKKDLVSLLALSIIISLVYFAAFFNFFTQDDFILINEFSQNNLLRDLVNVFGLPTVTHWRPMHNLYFLIAGNIFGKNYIGYHVLTLILHILTSFFVYKTVQNLTKSSKAALISGLIYGIHPAHFVSLFWISGGTTLIGFFFLITSIYNYLTDKKKTSLILYILALLASEAMIVGVVLLYCINTLKQKGVNVSRIFLIQVTIVSLMFGIIRLLLLTPETTFETYQVQLSSQGPLLLTA